MTISSKSTTLKKGYTTGVHTSFAFKTALDIFFATSDLTISKTNKMNNDDLDVTKGCEIIVSISSDINKLELNKINHKPYILTNKYTTMELYAGQGVGVVTKNGLKPQKGYLAINPVPLDALKALFLNTPIKNKIYCTISVTNGENIAKNTANSKVGVIGGISILGSTGYVKPISATAYIHSIEQELNFAKANGYKTIIFTLGNSAYKSVQNIPDVYIIEIGNFIYDGIGLAVKKEFKDIQLFLGIGKAVKISQGFKNTHNRFGGINFTHLQKNIDIDIKKCLTVKAVRELLENKADQFDILIINQTQQQLYKWFNRDICVTLS